MRRRRIIHPQGWGFVLVAMCLISLSLFRVLDLARSWCITSFAIIVESYDVSPPLLSCKWVFPLKLSYRIVSLRIWEHLMYVLHVLTCGDNGIFMWSTWCMFWWSTCGFRNIVNLCIGVGTRFRLDSPVETLGHSLKYFVLVWINLRLCDAYRIIIPTDTWGDISVLVDLCLKVLF